MKKKEEKKALKSYENIEFTWAKSILGKYKLLKKMNRAAYRKSMKPKA